MIIIIKQQLCFIELKHGNISFYINKLNFETHIELCEGRTQQMKQANNNCVIVHNVAANESS